jgi:hypothetical protein
MYYIVLYCNCILCLLNFSNKYYIFNEYKNK